jgi:hypothetical protein
MARKQTKGAKPMIAATAGASEEVLKAVRLDIPLSMHRELRIEAAKRDMSMAALVRGLVEEFLSKRKAGGR